MWTASLLVTCLLAVAGLGEAARSKEQRRAERNPYFVSPPGSPRDVGEGRPSRGLGERSFVGCEERLREGGKR